MSAAPLEVVTVLDETDNDLERASVDPRVPPATRIAREGGARSRFPAGVQADPDVEVRVASRSRCLCHW